MVVAEQPVANFRFAVVILSTTDAGSHRSEAALTNLYRREASAARDHAWFNRGYCELHRGLQQLSCCRWSRLHTGPDADGISLQRSSSLKGPIFESFVSWVFVVSAAARFTRSEGIVALFGSLLARRDGREEGRVAQAEILGRGPGARRAVNCSHSSPDGRKRSRASLLFPFAHRVRCHTI